jgi:hypothetical protein
MNPADGEPKPMTDITDARLSDIEADYCADTAVHHRVRSLVAAVRSERTQNARLRLGLSMLIKVHAAVNFDTDEDNVLRDRAVETARFALEGR